MAEAIECNKPGCGQQMLGECTTCKREFCERHLKPTLTGSRSFIGSLTNPELRRIYEEEDKSDDGHPCPNYTMQFLDEVKIRQEKARIPFDKLREMLDAFVGTEITGVGSEKCHVPGCNRNSVAICRDYCKRSYCSQHRYPILTDKQNPRTGHPCTPYTNHMYLHGH